jgi:hypothetical protein
MSAYSQQRPRKRLLSKIHVCFDPKSGRVQRNQECLLWAKSGHPGSTTDPRGYRRGEYAMQDFNARLAIREISVASGTLPS